MDLTAVEGLADLIFAETEAQRAQAMRQYQGLLGRVEDCAGGSSGRWLVEARIDFSDEADVPRTCLLRRVMLRELLEEIENLNDEHRGERLREGLVVRRGPLNAGVEPAQSAGAARGRDRRRMRARPAT